MVGMISDMVLDARIPVFGGLAKKKGAEFVQSDQQLSYSHFEKYKIKTCNKPNFNFLSSLCS